MCVLAPDNLERHMFWSRYAHKIPRQHNVVSVVNTKILNTNQNKYGGSDVRDMVLKGLFFYCCPCLFILWKCNKINYKIILNHNRLHPITSSHSGLPSAWTSITFRHFTCIFNSLHCWQCIKTNLKASASAWLWHFGIIRSRRMLSSLSADAHLTQLFVQSGGPGLSCRVTLRTEHLLVPVDEVAVAQSDHLHAGIQTIERGMWFSL